MITLSVLLAFNTIKNRLDWRSMRRNLAELLYNELRANRDEIYTCQTAGLSQRPSTIDGVYSGLLSSGNMKYIKEHQVTLYRLYASMARNEKNVVDAISEQMRVLHKIFQGAA